MNKQTAFTKNNDDISPSNDEVELIEKIKNGDKPAFKEIFEMYYDSLARFAYRHVQSRTLAEEVVQDVFLWIWENRERWQVNRSLKTYLFKAVRNKAIDYWRKQQTRHSYLDQYSTENEKNPSFIDLPDNANGDEFLNAARDAIEELPERRRMVYKLSRLEGLTYKEIAEVMEISPKTVETQMSRALDFLRKELSHYLPQLLLLELIHVSLM